MLEIKNLYVSVDKKAILKGVSVEVAAGKVVVIMGPNGSGKSTLAMTVAGHPRYEVAKSKVKAKKSKVIMDGKDLLGMSPDERAKRGLFLAFQYPVGIEGVTPEQLLRRTVGYKDVLSFRRKVEREALKLGIEKTLLRRSLSEGFSGGEKKKMEILQMQMMKPKYVILDETDSGLDIDALKIIARNVRALVKRRVGVLLITHYQRFLKYLVPDKVLVMVGGKIVARGERKLVEELEKSGYKKYV